MTDELNYTDGLEYTEGHDEPCYYCGELCNKLAGNPSLWPLPLCHPDDPGRVKWHHTGCISDRLHGRLTNKTCGHFTGPLTEEMLCPYCELDKQEEELKKLREALGHIQWIKDCGVDGKDEHGVFRNFPDTERDAMYDIATKAIGSSKWTKRFNQ